MPPSKPERSEGALDLGLARKRRAIAMIPAVFVVVAAVPATTTYNAFNNGRST